MTLFRLSRFSGGIFRRQFITLFGTAIFFFGSTWVALLQVTGKALIDRQLDVSSAYRDEIRFRIVDWLEERRSDVEYLARSIDSEEAEEITPEMATRKVILFGATASVFRDVALVDSNGMVIDDRAGRAEGVVDVSDQEYFRAAIRGQSFVSGLVRDAKDNEAEIAVSEPLRWPGAKKPHPFCVVGFLPVGALSTIVENVSLRDLGSAYLLDGEGRIISVADYASRLKLFGPESAGVLVDTYAAHEIAAGHEGRGRYRGYGGGKVVGAYAKIEPTGFGLAVELSEERALAPVTAVLDSGLVFLFIALVILFFVSAVLSAHFVEPIRALISAAEAVIRDKAHDAIDIRTGTEIDQLVQLFNKMAATVREREEGLRDSAARDSLTGLYNHARIEEFLELELRRKRRSGQELSFVMMDIDHFKRVNDSYGHLVGDEVLRGIAGILEEEVRGGDIAGRYGGEEFSVILDASSDEEVAAFCERIRSKVEERDFWYEGRKVKATISIGWIRAAVDGFSASDFVRGADRALYAAKAAGRNRVVAAEALQGPMGG